MTAASNNHRKPAQLHTHHSTRAAAAAVPVEAVGTAEQDLFPVLMSS